MSRRGIERCDAWSQVDGQSTGFEPGMGLVIDIFFLSDVVDELKRVGFGKVEWKEKEGAMGERNIKN